MKRISVSYLREDHFDVIEFVEGVLSFDLNNPDKALENIEAVLEDTDSILAGLYSKGEKLKRGIDGQKEQLIKEQIKSLTKNVKSVYLQDASNSFFILEQKKAINEFTKIKKILVYISQIKEDILEQLIRSDSIDDWLLLAEIIYVQTGIANTVDTEMYVRYSKRLEERTAICFEESLSTGNFKVSKKCFEILGTVDKELVLIDAFLMAKDLLTATINIHPTMNINIDLIAQSEESNTFSTFLGRTEALVVENFNFICLVFGNQDVYTEHILSKIFKTLISMGLASFLNVTNPPIFLTCLQSAYTAANTFSDSLKNMFPNFDYHSCINDIFSPFLLTAALKEKQFFEDILDTFLTGAKSINKYFINGQEVKKSSDFMFIYHQMLHILDKFMSRSETIYSKENQKEVLQSMSIKMCELIEMMTMNYKNKMKLINDLIYIYLTNCKFFNDDGRALARFNEKAKDAIITEFDQQVLTSQDFISNECANMYFTKEDCHKHLEEHLKTLFASPCRMGDKNLKLLAYRIVETLCKSLQKQTKVVELNEEKLRRVYKCIDDLFSTLPINFANNFLGKFNNLKEVAQIKAGKTTV